MGFYDPCRGCLRKHICSRALFCKHRTIKPVGKWAEANITLKWKKCCNTAEGTKMITCKPNLSISVCSSFTVITTKSPNYVFTPICTKGSALNCSWNVPIHFTTVRSGRQFFLCNQSLNADIFCLIYLFLLICSPEEKKNCAGKYCWQTWMLQDNITRGNQKNILFSYLLQLHFPIAATQKLTIKKTYFFASHLMSLSTADSVTKGHVLSVPGTLYWKWIFRLRKIAWILAKKGTAQMTPDENVT